MGKFNLKDNNYFKYYNENSVNQTKLTTILCFTLTVGIKALPFPHFYHLLLCHSTYMIA